MLTDKKPNSEEFLSQIIEKSQNLYGKTFTAAAAWIPELLIHHFQLEHMGILLAASRYRILSFSNFELQEKIDLLVRNAFFRFPRLWHTLYYPEYPDKSWFNTLPIPTDSPLIYEKDFKYRRLQKDISFLFKSLADAGIKLIMPITRENFGLGLLLIGGKPDQTPFSPEDLRNIRIATGILSIGFWNNFLLEISKNDETERSPEILNAVDFSRMPVKKMIEVKPGVNLIYRSTAMSRVLEFINLAARTDRIILILGASGTGKELVANLIHNKSEQTGPFIAINCASIPASLMEDELFGHEKGAFTGAVRAHTGRFEESNDGTLFLDEIGDMPLALQAGLLRVIQERLFRRVGGEKMIHWTGRLILATNKNLEKMVKTGEFREDLYYRVNVVTIRLPSLVDRKEDIIPLVDYFLKLHNKEIGRSVLGISEEVQRIFLNYYWPGNIRELENTIAQALIVCKRNILTSEDIPASIRSIQEQQKGDGLQDIIKQGSFEEIMREKEMELLQSAMRLSKNNKTEAAKLLKMNRNTLTYKLKMLGL